MKQTVVLAFGAEDEARATRDEDEAVVLTAAVFLGIEESVANTAVTERVFLELFSDLASWAHFERHLKEFRASRWLRHLSLTSAPCCNERCSWFHPHLGSHSVVITA